MNNTIQYKGYVGSIEFSEEDELFFGKVLGIRSLISYEGENAQELLKDFHEAIDTYLEVCEAEGKSQKFHLKAALTFDYLQLFIGSYLFTLQRIKYL